MKRILAIIFISILVSAFLMWLGDLWLGRAVLKIEDAGNNITLKSATRQEAKVLILIYHQIRELTPNDGPLSRQFIVSPAVFENQLQSLAAAGFQTISFADLADFFNGDYSLPVKPVIITFDDGTASQFENAFPLLQKYGLTATFFVFTNALSRNDRYLTWEQLKQMADAGMEIGSHGKLHQYMGKQETEEALEEIFGSKQELEEHLDKKISAIAYPFGSKSEAVIEQVKAAGYLAARDIVNGTRQAKADLFKLKAYFVTADEKRFGWLLAQ